MRIHPIIMLLAPLCVTVGGELPTRTNDLLPEVMGFWKISPEVREKANQLPTKALKLEYLTALVTNRIADSVADQGFKKASAIRLLGVIRDTNSVGVLVSVIAFKDVQYLGDRQIHMWPAVDSLAAIGEPAVPQLLDIVKEIPKEDMRVSLAVQTLVKIKGTHYEEFVKEQKNKLPEAAWLNLCVYAVAY
jgi:hypothetical protein